MNAPTTMPRRTRGEWSLRSARNYDSPFADVAITGTFVSPSGKSFVMPGFYDGEGTWRVRFNPGEHGTWRYRIAAHPHDPALAAEGRFEVTPREVRGFLRATPGAAWGFTHESGEPALIFGDTVYNLFGMAHCGVDVAPFLERRAAQGFNLLRIRVPVSSFHPPDGHNDWQTRSCWAWGGGEQAPRFDLFNLDWFRTVDRVMELTERLDIGVELIMEGWGFDFPFNHRTQFTTEWEELWMRYLIARYDAHANLAIWTPLNEYEFYPNGDWHHKPVADRWAVRIARWIKAVAPHGHVVAMHNGPRMPPFADDSAPIPRPSMPSCSRTGAAAASMTAGLPPASRSRSRRASPAGAAVPCSRNGDTSAIRRSRRRFPHTISAIATIHAAAPGGARSARSG